MQSNDRYRRQPHVSWSGSHGKDDRSPPQPPAYSQPERAFPFWKLALSIAAGILIASAIAWVAVELRMRYEAQQFAEAMQKELRELEAANVKRQQEAAHRQAVVREQRARQAEQQRQAEARRDKRPLVPQAVESMPAGTVACLGGYKAQRTANRRWQQLLVNGKAQPCRTG